MYMRTCSNKFCIPLEKEPGREGGGEGERARQGLACKVLRLWAPGLMGLGLWKSGISLLAAAQGSLQKV